MASATAPNALHLDSGLNGQTLTLATTGAGATAASLPQIITFGVNSSTVSTGTLSATAAQGDIDIAGYIQATLGRTAEFQAKAGNIYETDAAFDTPSAATTPTGHFLVSRLAAQAGPLEGGVLYSVILDSTQNVLKRRHWLSQRRRHPGLQRHGHLLAVRHAQLQRRCRRAP